MDGWIRIGTKLDTSKFDAQAKELMYKIQDMEEKAEPLKESIEEYAATIKTIQEHIDNVNKGLYTSEEILEAINKLAENGFDFRYDFADMTKEMSEQEAFSQILLAIQEAMSTELQDETREYERINNQIGIYKSKLEKAEKSQNKMVINGTKGLKSLTKSAKTLILGLVGIHGIYSVLSKISSAALNNNEKLGKQIETIWTGLGALLEPVIEIIVTLFKKAATAVLYFIGLLTGENYIEKANATILKNREKQLKNQTKATKELTKANQKFSASFDELNLVQEKNIDTLEQQNEIDTFDNSLLFNVNDLSKSTLEFLDKLKEKIDYVVDKVKKLIDWGKEHPELLIGILGGTALLTLLAKIMGVSGVSGLLGIFSILTAIAAIGVITIGIKMMTDDVNDYFDLVDDIYERHAKKVEEVREEQQQFRDDTSVKQGKELDEYIDKLLEATDVEYHYQVALSETEQSQSDIERWWNKINGQEDLNNALTDDSVKKEWEYLKTLRLLYKQGKLSSKQEKEYLSRLQKFNEQMKVHSLLNKEWIYYANESSDALKEINGESKSVIDLFEKMEDTTFHNIWSLDEFAESVGDLNKLFGTTNDEIEGVFDNLEKLPDEVNININENTQEVLDATSNLMDDMANMFSKPQKITLTAEAQKVLDTTSKVIDDMVGLTSKTYKVKVDSTMSTIQTATNNLIKSLNELTKKQYKINLVLNTTSKVAEDFDGLFMFIESKPKNMATGGVHIVNNPGKGVISGSARIGEAGAEGIIPLTDSSALQMIADAIASKMVVNATIINKMNSRIISKEVQQALVESGFAANV